MTLAPYRVTKSLLRKNEWAVSGPKYHRVGLAKREAEIIAGEMNSAFEQGRSDLASDLRSLIGAKKDED